MSNNVVSLASISTSTGTSVYGVQTNKVALVSINGTYTTFSFAFQGSTDGGLTWDAIAVVAAGTFSLVTGTISPSNSSTSAWYVSTNGVTHIRLLASALASGTVNVTVMESDSFFIGGLPLSVVIQGGAGSASAAWFEKITDGTNNILSASAANLTAATASSNAIMVQYPAEWMVTSAPAVNNQASASKSAGAAGVRHVCTSVSFALCQDATGGTPFAGTVNLRDGATGAGTVLGTWYIAVVTAAASNSSFSLTGLNIPGTAATAMTLEFTAAGGAHTLESTTISGYDIV